MKNREDDHTKVCDFRDSLHVGQSYDLDGFVYDFV